MVFQQSPKWAWSQVNLTHFHLCAAVKRSFFFMMEDQKLTFFSSQQTIWFEMGNWRELLIISTESNWWIHTCHIKFLHWTQSSLDGHPLLVPCTWSQDLKILWIEVIGTFMISQMSLYNFPSSANLMIMAWSSCGIRLPLTIVCWFMLSCEGRKNKAEWIPQFFQNIDD